MARHTSSVVAGHELVDIEQCDDDRRQAVCSCGWRSHAEEHGWEAGQGWLRHRDGTAAGPQR